MKSKFFLILLFIGIVIGEEFIIKSNVLAKKIHASDIYDDAACDYQFSQFRSNYYSNVDWALACNYHRLIIIGL